MTIVDPLWTSSEFELILGAKSPSHWYASGLQMDSRLVVPGDLFIALEGDNSDGHDYVKDAFRRGAVAALVHKTVHDIAVTDRRLYFVDHTHDALLKIAAAARARVPASVLAVTGSVGKTSIVQAVRTALSHSFPTHSSIKSFNNHVGVPLSLARMDRNCRQAIFELGMSSEGEIAPLAALVKPDVALVTTVGSAHTQSFDSLKAIADEKAAIFTAVKPGGTAIIGMGHAYDAYLVSKAQDLGLKTITVGLTEAADIHPEHLYENHECSCVTFTMKGQAVTVKVNQPGREWVQNALMILVAVDTMGGDLAEAGLTLASLKVEKGRGRLYQLPFAVGEMTLQDDSYNANPVSMAAAINRFSMIPPQKGQSRVAILGDMAELGDDSAQEHLRLMPLLRRAGVDQIIALGPFMQAAAEQEKMTVICCENLEEVIKAVDDKLIGREAVFVKGSNRCGLGKVVEHLLKQSRRVSKTRDYESRHHVELISA